MNIRLSVILSITVLLATGAVSNAAPSSSNFCIAPPTGTAALSPQAYELRERLQAEGLRRLRERSRSASLKAETAQVIRPALGTIRALVLVADFPDMVATTTVSSLQDKLFSKGTLPTGSFRDYYLENSYGKFDVQGDVIGDPKSRTGWLRLRNEYGYYANNQFGLGDPPHSAKQLIVDAIEAAFKANPDLDPSKYDADGDGRIDMLMVIHAGGGSEGTTDPSQIWSHHASLDVPVVKKGFAFTEYVIMAEDSNIGIYAHEAGHILGLPDLYGTANSSSGLGYWSLMAAGSHLPRDTKQPLNIGTRPGHLDPWCKMKLGWLEPVVITVNSPQIGLPAVEKTPYVIKVPADPLRPEEYFLIENRWADASNFDQYLPGSGALIYHVDESRKSNDDRGRPLIRVIEADGNFNLLFPLGHPNNNLGDATDPWSSKSPRKIFGPRTIPGSVNYSGRDSHLVVENFSASGETMTLDIRFDYGQGSITVTVITADAQPAPDVALKLSQGGTVLDKTPTVDDQGRYVFGGLLEGPYTVLLSAEGYIPVSKLVPYIGGRNINLEMPLVPQPTLTMGWNLLGLPMDFGQAKASEVFTGGAEAGSRVFAYDTAAVQYITDPVMRAGQGQWVFVKNPADFAITQVGTLADPDLPFTVDVKAGWNLVANPFLVPLPWDPTLFTLTSERETRRLDAAAATGWARDFVWIYDPAKGYIKVTPPAKGSSAQTIPVWGAFWFRSSVDGVLSLALPKPG
ncbi:MAG: M6 family metalloprotease domain-containing protein [Armatimonadota bacterium]